MIEGADTNIQWNEEGEGQILGRIKSNCCASDDRFWRRALVSTKLCADLSCKKAYSCLTLSSGTQSFILTRTNEGNDSRYKRPLNFTLLPHHTAVNHHNYYSRTHNAIQQGHPLRYHSCRDLGLCFSSNRRYDCQTFVPDCPRSSFQRHCSILCEPVPWILRESWLQLLGVLRSVRTVPSRCPQLLIQFYSIIVTAAA